MIHRCLLTVTSLLAFAFCTHAQDWKTYPYQQQGSVLTFPDDEGYHPGEVVEWWYTNAHVTGDSSGKKYSFMLTYFYYPLFGFSGFRIFNISNDSDGGFYQETQPCQYPTLSQDHLEIKATVGLLGLTQEKWETLKDTGGNLIPFQYHIEAASGDGAIDVSYNTLKRPLMVGETGFLYQGITGYTYYYSQTKLEVSGTLTLQGITEPVSGFAWLDRQWGQFNPSTGEQYAWFSMQLSNGLDLNLWNIFNTKNQIPDTSTYRFCSIYKNDSSSSTIDSFKLERLNYSYTTDGTRCYDQQWHLTFDSVDLIITTRDSSHEVFFPFRFFEGTTDITGTVGGVPVTGVGFAELLHSFAKPQINITSPTGYQYSTPITWQLLNPYDGRDVYYDVEVSTDDKASYTKIAAGLTDTSFNWTHNLPNGTEGWFRITGYSIDSTLSGFDISDSAFIIGFTGITETANENISIVSYPNPFDDKITIAYDVKQAGQLEIDILNIEGAVIKTLHKGFVTSGKHTQTWDGTNKDETVSAAGIYFYRFRLNENNSYGKMLKIK